MYAQKNNFFLLSFRDLTVRDEAVLGVDQCKRATLPLPSNSKQRETTCKWPFTRFSAARSPSESDIIPWTQIADPTGSKEITDVISNHHHEKLKSVRNTEAKEECVRSRDYKYGVKILQQGFAIKKTRSMSLQHYCVHSKEALQGHNSCRFLSVLYRW